MSHLIYFLFQQPGEIESTLGLIILFLIVGLIVFFAWKRERNKVKKVAEAKAAYRSALEALKDDPFNPHLRSETLRIGRRYCHLARKLKQQNGIAIFDEVALSNDINAACAGANERGSNYRSIEDRLAMLNRLKEAGTIDEAEFHFRKQRILNEV